jgi:hypothetical protein
MKKKTLSRDETFKVYHWLFRHKKDLVDKTLSQLQASIKEGTSLEVSDQCTRDLAKEAKIKTAIAPRGPSGPRGGPDIYRRQKALAVILRRVADFLANSFPQEFQMTDDERRDLTLIIAKRSLLDAEEKEEEDA